jgi:hypothetical protein
MAEFLTVVVALTVVGLGLGAVATGHLRSRSGAPGRLRRFTNGREVTVPMGVEFRHDGATLPRAMPPVMAAKAHVTCCRERGVLKVQGGRMVPGFDAGFWTLLAAQSATGRWRCLRRDDYLLVAVPMAHPPSSGVHVRLREDDLTILAQSLRRAHPGSAGR